jgi:hypothetical protein
MKSSISRSAAWRLFHFSEGKPDVVVAALDDKTEVCPQARSPAQGGAPFAAP